MNLGKIAQLFLIVFSLTTACTHKQLKPAEVDINYDPFFLELGKPDSAQLMHIILKYNRQHPTFFHMYTQGLLNIHHLDSVERWTKMNEFIHEPIYSEILDTVEAHFSDLSSIEKEITTGLGRTKTAFPNLMMPNIYWIVSGFNDPVALTDSLVAVSLEHYLGENHEFYDRLGVYKYLRTRKESNRIPIDVLEGWLKTELPYNGTSDKLLEHVVYEGKIMHLMMESYPNRKPEEIFSYTSAQYQWCVKSERAIWTSIIEWKHLYETKPDILREYLGEAPFTKSFGYVSAPRLGRFVGYQIIHAYLKKNPQVTYEQLFANKDAQTILQQSGYRP